MQRKSASRDRTGQKASETRMTDLAERGGPFVAAVEATRMPMVVTDPGIADNPIVYANAAFLRMCGYEMHEVLGQTYDFLGGESTDAGLVDRVRSAMSAQRELTEEVLFYRKDGRPIWVTMFVSPIVQDGRVVQHFASYIDITQRVEAEHALKEARDMLECRVAERTRRLDEANARLEEEVERRTRMEAVLRDTLMQREEDLRYKTFLVREIDHRTKNALQTAVTLLQVQMYRTAEPSCAQALQAAMDRLGRMAGIHALLYRGDQPDSIEFAGYLRQLVHDLGETLQPSPGQVEVAVDAQEASWSPDLVLSLGLIVGEALTNAMRHAFPDGRKGRVTVTLDATGSGLMRLSVEDDGVGLPKKRREGALGLELVETFASKAGGKAAIGPGRTRGTSVVVTFPDPDGP